MTGVKPFHFSNKPQLVLRTAKGEGVQGVTCVGKEVVIVGFGKAEVEVCDINTLTEQRCLPVTGLRRLYDMTTCAQKKCLFIIDCVGVRVYRLDLNGRVTSWTVNGNGSGLSMTAYCNVLVTFNLTSKLKEFTQDGQLILEIRLQQDVARSHHTVQIVIASHQNGDQHRVGLVGDDGRVI